MYLTKTIFFKHLLASPKTRLIVCNVLTALDMKSIDDAFARDLFDWWRDLWIWQIKKYYPRGISNNNLLKEIINSFNQLLYHNKPIDFRVGESKPDFFLAGVNIKVGDLKSAGKFLTVMDGCNPPSAKLSDECFASILL